MEGIAHRKTGYKPLRCLGFDTETVEGPPCTFQIYGENVSEVVYLYDAAPSEVFCALLERYVAPRETIVLWAHNYGFDLPSCLYDIAERLATTRFDFAVHGWKFRGVRKQGGAMFAHLIGPGRRRVELRDTMRFYQGSLDNVGKLVRPDLPKLERLDWLGKRQPVRGDRAFEAYAMRDAELAYYIGREIMGWHERSDISLTVSAANFAASEFTHNFVPPGAVFRRPQEGWTGGCYLAYHGGKNLYPHGKPARFEDVHVVDIKSAYPHAMTQLPDFLSNRWEYGNFCLSNPDCFWGVYKLTGTLRPCKYPVVYGPKMQPQSGRVVDLWVAGPDLCEAMISGELKLESAVGLWYVDDPTAPHPLREFANHFFTARKNSDNPVDRQTYKIILNSLSGKFAELRRDKEELSEYTDQGLTHEPARGVPGLLFHPFVAALITAHTRSRIHALEHATNAIHTSTDGIITQNIDGLRFGNNLGDLSIEASGTADIVRCKLYVIRDADGNVVKEARHGFRGKLSALLNCIDNNTTEYDYIRCNTLKESIKRGLVLNRFDSYHAKIGGKHV